ncbi:YlxM family DNA-binding protein [Anaerosporobacter sp.]|uniref:YlxM family DNA-binding protein n=1 Tax=Anaerosporobacter sp. TaxID=1872529 RepID=UPI00286F4BDA|nr:YlxM family DNA-binding protein [Anaerosporobacter sp.]
MSEQIEKKDNNIKQIDKLVELSLLYDFYGELLKENQKYIYEDYILNDLSLSEIAEHQGISRQGVHDIVKRCSNQLINYEEKLHLIEKFEQTKQKVGRIKELSGRILTSNASELPKECALLTEIESLSDSILEDL